jgi:hypothetical protein
VDNQTHRNLRRLIALRVLAYCLAAILIGLLALCGAIYASSLSPEPGAVMRQMGIVMLAGPMALVGTALLAVTWWRWNTFRRFERWMFGALGATVVLPCLVVWLAG